VTHTPHGPSTGSHSALDVGNRGRDPFGEPSARPLPVDIVHLLGEVGAYGVNFHDNDLVPIDARRPERTGIVRTRAAVLR